MGNQPGRAEEHDQGLLGAGGAGAAAAAGGGRGWFLGGPCPAGQKREAVVRANAAGLQAAGEIAVVYLLPRKCCLLLLPT